MARTRTSTLPLLATLLGVLLLLPSAAVAKAIDATNTLHLDLPDGLIGPESVAFNRVGEFRKTRHPRNVEFNKVLEACFSGAGNSRFSEAWNL
jgi:hypothetical protein